jgi:hypothetical protein
MLISNEIALYGEHIKQFVTLSPRDVLVMNGGYICS